MANLEAGRRSDCNPANGVFYQPSISFKVVDGVFSLEDKMGKRKIDPVTGKCIKRPSDINRTKRAYKKKLRTREEKSARNEAESSRRCHIRYNAKVSVNRQKVQHTDDVACRNPRSVKPPQWRRATPGQPR